MAVTSDEFQAAFAAYRAEAAHGVLDTGRYKMRYFAWGSGGRPVVFVHGMSDAARAFIMVMRRLLPRITGIAYELPDGQTDGSHLARYTHEAYAADLVALLDHLKLPKAAVVGSSFGSTVMLAALAAYPERFTHAVSQNGFAHRPLNRWQRQLARSGRFWPGWFADWPEIYRGVMWKVDRPTLSSLPRDVEQFYLSDGGRTPMRASALRSLAIDRTDFRSALPGIRVPVLVLTSDRDTLVPPECGATLLRLLPDARHVEFTNCGHHPQYSHPGPMAGAIAAFLQERDSEK